MFKIIHDGMALELTMEIGCKVIFQNKTNQPWVKGAHLEYANGWTISLQFGTMNYCENYSRNISEEKCGLIGSRDAEIAAWDKNGGWYRFDCDTAKGQLTPEEVFDFIQKISKL